MATILEFPHQPATTSRTQSAKAGPAAEIVIFPGVRYERTEEPKRARQMVVERDRLTLVD